MSQSTPQPGSSSPGGSKDPVPAPRPDRSASPGVRASDAEREAVVERLRVASVEGRLTLEELTERSEAAYAAVSRDDLERITADLPGMGAPGAEPAPLQVKRRFSAIMGDCKERIVGRIDEPLEAVSVMGDVELDLRGAQVPTGEVRVQATAIMGDVKIIVPDGIAVEVDGYAFLGERKVAVRESGGGARVPIVRVTARVVMGDVKIVDDEHHAPVRRAIGDWWRGRNS
ncbi:DUF1707 SHOCT-like domain-containing protein [Actinomadura algeriensis]|uniref:Cell wall-active antibiotic response 4TMS protein YvqF n=1 Tax=Actinomadura algeriensis TaxID=1679523 RepID=A0ABR9K431_9ACTN|nr:DUF1707 domain-containing protein [Actinomadura algeriensis]MBE1537577.1 hypothetical protein [Actinomadura algeriensis]